jgi:hypothetical protein
VWKGIDITNDPTVLLLARRRAFAHALYSAILAKCALMVVPPVMTLSDVGFSALRVWPATRSCP